MVKFLLSQPKIIASPPLSSKYSITNGYDLFTFTILNDSGVYHVHGQVSDLGAYQTVAGLNGATNGAAATANTGSGGGGASGASGGSGGAGGSGVVILRYPSDYTATYTSGVTRSTYTVGSDRVDIITATSNSSQTVTFAEA